MIWENAEVNPRSESSNCGETFFLLYLSKTAVCKHPYLLLICCVGVLAFGFISSLILDVWTRQQHIFICAKSKEQIPAKLSAAVLRKKKKNNKRDSRSLLIRVKQLSNLIFNLFSKWNPSDVNCDTTAEGGGKKKECTARESREHSSTSFWFQFHWFNFSSLRDVTLSEECIHPVCATLNNANLFARAEISWRDNLR